MTVSEREQCRALVEEAKQKKALETMLSQDVCLSVCPVLCGNGSTYHQTFFNTE